MKQDIRNTEFNLKPVAAAVMIAASGPGFAQSSDTTDDAYRIEELVVTAQKREESLQDVPLSLTAFSGDQLKSLGIENQDQLIFQTPGLDSTDYGPARNFKIRGMGTLVFDEASESSVAFYRDEIYRPIMAANSAQLFDVERVEVLRGPQGTLYGRNTNAGLVHVYSARPTEEFEGYGEIQVGNYGQIVTEGALSGAIADGIRGRLSVKYNKNDGYQENLGSGGGDFRATDVFAVRGQLAFDIGDSAELLLRASHSQQRNTGTLYNMRGALNSTLTDLCSPDAVLSNSCFAVDDTFRC